MSRVRGWWVASAVLTIMVLPALAGPAAASSFTWTLTCKGAQGDTTASWEWLQDGHAITGAGGTATSCGSSGGGVRPPSANGFAVTLTISTTGSWDSKTVTQSFDPAGSFSTSLKVSFSFWAVQFCHKGFQLCKVRVSGSAVFALDS